MKTLLLSLFVLTQTVRAAPFPYPVVIAPLPAPARPVMVLPTPLPLTPMLRVVSAPLPVQAVRAAGK
jgi:hypothetical protein